MFDRSNLKYKFCTISNYLDKGPVEVEMTLEALIKRFQTFQPKNWSNIFEQLLTFEDYHYWKKQGKHFAKLSKEANIVGDKVLRAKYSEESKLWKSYEQDVKNGKAFLPYTYKDYGKKTENGKSNARHKDNVAEATLVVLDLDSGVTPAEVQVVLKDFEFVLMSSISETAEQPRFRVVLFPDRPLAVKEQVELVRRIDARLPEKNAIDQKTFAVDPVGLKDEQLYFFPAWIHDNPIRPTTIHNKGRLITVDDFALTEELLEKIARRESEGKQFCKVKSDEQAEFFKTQPASANSAIHYIDGKPYLHPEAELETEEGYITVQNINDLVSMVTCPLHYDANGTEFAWRNNKSGKVWLRCKHCGDIKERDPVEKLWSPKAAISTALKARSEKTKELATEETSTKKLTEAKRKQLLEYFPKDRFSKPETNEEKFKKLTSIAQGLKGTNILYAPEGYGKSFMIIALLKMGKKILFCTQTNDQAGEKALIDFAQWVKDEQHGLSITDSDIHHLYSKEWKFKQATDGEVDLVTSPVFNPWDRGSVNREKTVDNILLWGDRHDYIPKGMKPRDYAEKIFDECYQDVTVDHFTTLIAEKTIITTTLARLAVIGGTSGMYKWLNEEWVIFLDDPGTSDVKRLFKYTDGMSKARDAENDRREMKGLKPLPPLEEITITRYNTEAHKKVRYWIKPEDKVPGLSMVEPFNPKITKDAYSPNKIQANVVHTTTEALTLSMIVDRYKIPEERIHDMMDNVIGGSITMIGTWLVRSHYDQIIPAMIVRLKQLGSTEKELTLIGDGMSSEVNLVNNKGINTLKNHDTVIEISKPHTERVLELNDELCWLSAGEPKDSFSVLPDSDAMRISGILAYDQLNQALGRNSGHRAAGGEAIALVEPLLFDSFQTATRYQFTPWSFLESTDSNPSRLKKKMGPWLEHGEKSSPLVKQLVAWLRDPLDFVDNHLLLALEDMDVVQSLGATSAAHYIYDFLDKDNSKEKVKHLGGRRIHPDLEQ